MAPFTFLWLVFVIAKVETERSISAPQERVLEDVEFLTESQTGVGTRFKEIRLMKGREATSTLAVTEYEPPSTVGLVSDEGGTIWDTIFTVTPKGDGSVLKMRSATATVAPNGLQSAS